MVIPLQGRPNAHEFSGWGSKVKFGKSLESSQENSYVPD